MPPVVRINAVSLTYFKKERVMPTAVIVDGARTPFLRAGTIKNLHATTLAATLIQEFMRRYPGIEEELNYVIGANIGGQFLPPDGSNFARVVMLNAGLPKRIGAWTVNVNCASGLHAVLDAVCRVEAGDAKCVLVIGAEVMSDFPALYPREQREIFIELNRISRSKENMLAKLPKLAKILMKKISMPHSPKWMLEIGLTDPFIKMKMDLVAEAIATEWGITREEQDKFSLESQRRASQARAKKRFAQEIIPFEGFSHDNGIRDKQTLQQLAKLKPTYSDGTITAGNSSQISDGAAVILVAEEEFTKSFGLPMLARMSMRHSALVGCEPDRMGLGPVRAIRKLLDCDHFNLRRNLSKFDIIETNEAFAAVVLAQDKTFVSWMADYLPFERVNVNGGAIALGHPLAASGTRLVLTCAKELALRDKTLGLVTLCIGGGQGEAAVIERI